MKRYDSSFKEQAVRLVTEQGKVYQVWLRTLESTKTPYTNGLTNTKLIKRMLSLVAAT